MANHEAQLLVFLRMAKEKPTIAAACLCERTLMESDGTISIIRMVDQFTVGVPPDVVERLNPQLVLTLVVVLKSRGGLVGKHELVLQMHGPTKSQEPQPVEIEFREGSLSTVNATINIAVGVIKNFGECRIDLSFDGELLTTVPFRVVQGPAQATEGSETTHS